MGKCMKAMAILLILTMALSACGGGSSTGEAAPQDSAAASDTPSSEPAPAASGEVQKVTMIYNSSMGDQNTTNSLGLWPGYECEFIAVAENDIDAKILLEMISGSKSYDMSFTQASGAKQYGAMGLLEPLEPLPDQDDIFPANLAQHSIGDTLYGYPMLGDFFLLYYNTEAFADAGLTGPPKTFDEVLTYAKKLTKDGNGVRADEDGFDKNNIVQYGWQYMGGTGAGNCWQLCNYLYANGAHYITKDFNNMTYEVTCTAPEFKSSLQYVYDMFYVHNTMPSGFINYDYDEYDEMFRTGQVVMCLEWPALWGKCIGTDMESKIAVAEMPTGTTGQGGTPMGGWSVNIFKDAPHKEAAKEFAKLYCSKAGANAFLEANGRGMLVRTSFFEEKIAEAEAADNTAYADYWRMILKNAEVAQETDIAQTDTCASDTQEIASRYINMILSNQIGMDDGLEQMKTELESALADGEYMKS